MTRTFLQHHRQLRVAINAQISPNSGAGGVESFLIGLISALGRLDDGPEEYVIIGPYQDPDWLRPYLGPNQRIVRGPKRAGEIKRPFSSLPAWLRPLARQIHRWAYKFINPSISSWPTVPISDGFYEGLGCDVIHFPYQSFVLCALPSVFNPHDLQHVHYPQFFTPQQIARREVIYRAGCHFAHTVVVGSQWVKQDIIHHYGVNPGKIQVIPWAPPIQVYPEPSPEQLREVQVKYQLELPFALYPAMTWPHKNHLRLLEALAYLRDRENLIIRLVCTGSKYPRHWPQIEERLHALRLEGQVKFLGLVPPEDLRAIYRLAQFVIVPTLFEAASGPVFEAWQEGVPVACSSVTSLPEQAGDAALLFDPYSVEAIADAVLRMATNERLRRDLVEKGKRRLQGFSWERTAKAYRAVYRRAARHPLTEEDRWLLNWDWMREPRPKEKTL